MSKMDEFNLELQEQAEELGFETTEEALNAGYEVDMEGMKQGIARLCIDREQQKAHEAWLEEKQQVLEEQKELHDHLMELGYDNLAESVFKAIDFFKKGEL